MSKKESTVKGIIKEIKTNLKTKSTSSKDEVAVMQALLSDKSYEVGVYDKSGKVGTFCPADLYRKVSTEVIKHCCDITEAEASTLVEGRSKDITNAEATSMIGISKEFILTYLESGRKIHLGCREKSNSSLIKKEVKEGTRSYPKQVGLDDKGNPIFGKAEVKIDPYDGIKAISPCPAWIKK